MKNKCESCGSLAMSATGIRDGKALCWPCTVAHDMGFTLSLDRSKQAYRMVNSSIASWETAVNRWHD